MAAVAVREDGPMAATPRPYGGISAAERQSTRRARLLEACRDLVGREGVAGVTVEAVCGEASLGKRYFYESFATRDELLLAVADAFFVGLRSRMEEAIAGVDPAERPVVVVRTLVGALREDQREARLYVESPAVPVLAARREQAVADYAAFVAEVVLPDPPPEQHAIVRRRLASRLLVAGTTDLVTSWLAGDVEGDVDDVVDAIVAVGRGALSA